jgi:predicted permease
MVDLDDNAGRVVREIDDGRRATADTVTIARYWRSSAVSGATAVSQIRYAVRQLVLRPALSMVVIVILALGIGATTVIYSLFHQILMQPLPVPEPERLVNLRESGPKTAFVWCGNSGICDKQYRFSYPAFRELEAQQTLFTGIAAHHSGFEANLVYQGESVSGTGSLVSGSYFSVLNLQPALGRLIGPQDEPQVGESAVAVLSHDYWQTRFGGATDILGRTLTVNGQALTIIGVAPSGFSGTSIGSRSSVFIPLTLRWRMEPQALQFGLGPDNRLASFVNLFARLKPGTSYEQASTSIDVAYRAILEQEIPIDPSLTDEQIRQRRLDLEPGAQGQSDFPAKAVRPLTLLLAITALLLLIVCVNIANLLLARGASRAGEMAIRASIGATRRQLASQLLIEVAVLAVIGVIVCLPIAAITLGLIVTILPEQLAGDLAIKLRPGAVIVATATSVTTVIFFGLFPALHVARTDPGKAMKGQAAQSSGGRGMARVRGLLTTAQIAVSMVLLVLAGLFAQSLTNVTRVDLGMDVDSLVSFRVNPRLSGYSPDQVSALHDRMAEELAAQPGVASVASASVPVIAGKSSQSEILLAGFENAPIEERISKSNAISPQFFRTLAIPLLTGRDFTAQDRGVAIVNASFIRKFGLGTEGDAIGKRFTIRPSESSDVEIVGVVADTKYSDVKADVPPQVFLPLRPEAEGVVSWIYFYVRAGMDPDALIRTIASEVSRIAPDVPVSDLLTVRRQVRDNVYVDRVIAVLSAGFAGVATVLAVIGLFGVLAHNVALRTRELGVRLALGAPPSSLRAIVLRQVGAMVFLGGAIGLTAAIGFGRAAETLLFGLSGYEPSVLTAAAAVFVAVGLGAGYPAARRAADVAPLDALRQH